MPRRLTFIIRDLGHGGAQRQLVTLARGLAERGDFVVTVVHFYPGPFEAELRAAGVATAAVGKRSRWDLIGFFFRLARAVRAARPELIHGYLNEGNLMALALKPLCGWPKVVWGVRDSQTDAHQWGVLGKLSFKLNVWLSGWADLIIANSRAGKNYYDAQGYPAEKIEVVPNGIDEKRFLIQRDPALRRAWAVAPEDFLFGIIGRLNPMKDLGSFLRAAAFVLKHQPNVKFAIIGGDGGAYAAEMRALAQNLGLEGRIIWSPARQDMPAVYGALDAVVSSSAFGEGFSNVIGEAMASGLPCVATDVGDSAWLMNDASRIARPGDAKALAQCMLTVVAMTPEARAQMGGLSRHRILEHFTLDRMIGCTSALLHAVLNPVKRVTFITTGLGTGGAEMMLWQLATRLDRARFAPSVISLTPGGKYADLLRQGNVRVESLDLPPGKFTLRALMRLFAISRRRRPDVLVGWMYHGCLAAMLAKLFLLRRVPVVWSIRQSLYSLALEKKGSAWVIRALAPLSFFADIITYNSKVSARQHEDLGYRPGKRRLISNGFDLLRWQPRPEKPGVPGPFHVWGHGPFIGRFGRYATMKDYPTFLEAAARILKEIPDVHFILAGTHVDDSNESLRAEIASLGLTGHVHLLGERSDLPELTAALDIAVSSSAFGEGFPNVVGEAMACAVPVVATDIGDSAEVLGDAGRLVPPKNPEALANACLELLRIPADQRRLLGARGRRRIEEQFSLSATAQQFAALLEINSL